MKFSSFSSLAESEKLWLPVTTVGSSENGSTTSTFEWMIAWPTPAWNCFAGRLGRPAGRRVLPGPPAGRRRRSSCSTRRAPRRTAPRAPSSSSPVFSSARPFGSSLTTPRTTSGPGGDAAPTSPSTPGRPGMNMRNRTPSLRAGHDLAERRRGRPLPVARVKCTDARTLPGGPRRRSVGVPFAVGSVAGMPAARVAQRVPLLEVGGGDAAVVDEQRVVELRAEAGRRPVRAAGPDALGVPAASLTTRNLLWAERARAR